MNQPAANDQRGTTPLTVLLAVFVVLAVALIWMRQTAQTEPNLNEGRAVADGFLELVCKGQAGAAWGSTAAEFKIAEGRESFIAYVKNQTVLGGPIRFVAVQTVKVAGDPRAEYTYRAADGKSTVRLLAGIENGTWRVDRLKIE